MEDLHLKFDGAVGSTLTILEGTAPTPLPLKEPKIINISGDIHSVANFLKDRAAGHSSQQVDKNKAIVTVDKNGRTIVLQLDPENHYGATITGKLEDSKELEPFKINAEHTFTREGLLKLVRFARVWFDNKDQHTKIVENLSKITLKTETEMQAANDRQGNKKGMIDQKVNKPENWISEFILLAPIFKGGKNEKIRVEICMDVTATGFCFWLESPELVEAIEGAIDGIFTAELENCDGFVIIHK